MADGAADLASRRAALELDRLALENQKLKLDLERLQPSACDAIQRLSPLLGGVLAVAAFLFGVVQYVEQRQRELTTREAELARMAAARDQEFMKPLWERELAAYFLTSETVATIARTSDPARRRAAEEQFWQLYAGPLVILETKALSGAMVAFGHCLDGSEQCSESELRTRGLAVSSAIQQAIQEHAQLRLSEFSANKFQYHR